MFYVVLLVVEKFAELLNKHIDEDWAKNLSSLASLSKLADNASFQKKFMAIKLKNKIAA